MKSLMNLAHLKDKMENLAYNHEYWERPAHYSGKNLTRDIDTLDAGLREDVIAGVNRCSDTQEIKFRSEEDARKTARIAVF